MHNDSEKIFLKVDKISEEEKVDPANLNYWCEVGDLRGKQVGKNWFIEQREWETNGRKMLNDKKEEERRAIRSPLALISLFVLLVSIVNWSPYWERFERGSNLLLETAASGIGDGGSFGTLIRKTEIIYERSINNLIFFWDKAKNAWINFISGENTSAGPIITPEILNTLKEEIRIELLTELQKNQIVAPVLTSTPTQSTGNQNLGLVVLPSSNNSVNDQEIKRNIADSFSDRVEVRFDPSGQTGIITPINNSNPRENYLFIITPLKSN